MCKNEKPAPVVQCGVPGNLSGKVEEVVETINPKVEILILKMV